jgi:drug/metabolite transporter (DMT)-like permease
MVGGGSRSGDALRGITLTSLALTAFAANSLLCRFALHSGDVDPVGFTVVRLASAALALLLLMRVRHGGATHPTRSGNWVSAFWLFVYAITFSYAYVQLETGTGALLAFGAVQVTMILFGLLTGERPPRPVWAGLLLALGGVVYLLLPGASAPNWLPAVSMVLAGIAWGIYSLRGRGVRDPGAATCGNFVRTVPMVLVVGAVFVSRLQFTTQGLVAGIASGAIASGLGYILWYRALAYLTATRAAIVQLAAPILAALGGVAFLAEALSSRLVFAALAVFSGVVLAATSRRQAG